MGILGKQGISNTIISYLGIIVGFVNVIILQPLMLSPEELGLIRMLYSVSILLATIFPLGINGITTRFFPVFRNHENGHHGYIGLICCLALVFYLIFGIVIFVFKDAIFSSYQNSQLFIQYFSYVFPLTFFLGFLSIINFYAFSLFKAIVPAFLNEVFNRLLITVVVSLYFLKFISFNLFVFAFVLVYGIQLVLLVYYIWTSDKISLKINFVFLKSIDLRTMIKYGVLMSLTILASMALRNIDILLLGSNLHKSRFPLDSVAIYTIAYTIGSLIETPTTALTKIADPRISEAFNKNDIQTIKNIYYESTQVLTIVGGFLFVCLVVNIHEFLYFLPSKYQEGNFVVFFISMAAFFNMATGINGSIIYYSKYYIYGSILLFILVVLSVFLNYILIPIYGINGAAFASFFSLFIFNLFKFILIYKNFNFQPYNFNTLKISIIILSSIFLGLYFNPPLTNYLKIIFRLVFISIIYFIGLYKFNLVNIITNYIPYLKDKVWIKKISNK